MREFLELSHRKLGQESADQDLILGFSSALLYVHMDCFLSTLVRTSQILSGFVVSDLLSWATVLDKADWPGCIDFQVVPR